MKKTRKVTIKWMKLWAVLALVLSLVAVQTVQIIAEASENGAGTPDSTITVSSISELIEAVENAADGDVIGIDSKISIDTNVGQIGSENGKQITIVRMNEGAYFDIPSGGSVSFCNMVFEGNGSNVTGTMSMFYVLGTVNLSDVVIQNCSTANGNGGAVYADITGTLNADRVVFDRNTGYRGGHVYVTGEAFLRNCILKNGLASTEGGAAMSSNKGVLNMSDCKVYGNAASTSGGGIHNNATVTLTRCAVYANTAYAGADIANDTGVIAFSMDSIADSLSLYEEDGITPIEWVFDCENGADGLTFIFDVFNPNSLMKLVYEGSLSGGDTEESGGNTEESGGNTEEGGGNTEEGGGNTENGGNTEESGGNTEGGGTEEGGGNTEGGDTENSGNIEDDNIENGGNTESGGTENGGNAEGGNTGESNNGSENGGSTEDNSNKPESGDNTGSNGDGSQGNNGGVSGNDGGTSGGSSLNNDNETTSGIGTPANATSNNTTTNYEDKSTTTTTTENHEDRSTTNTENNEDKSTTTYNYYTYNTPSANPGENEAQEGSSVGTAPNTRTSASVSVTPAEETFGVSGDSASNTVDNIPETSENVQIPDNIKLDLSNVDIVYEMNGGISNIEISNQRETAEAMENMVETMTISEEEPAVDAQTVNWYEVIKMLLLAAIFIVVVPKPSLRLKKEN